MNPPVFLCEPRWGDLGFAALHLRLFPDAPVHLLTEPPSAAAFLRGLDDGRDVVLSCPNADEAQQPIYQAVLHALAEKKHTVVGICSDDPVTVWAMKVLRPKKVRCGPLAGDMMQTIRHLGATKRSLLAFPQTLYCGPDLRPLTPEEAVLLRLGQAPMPTLGNTGGAHWSFFAYFGMDPDAARGLVSAEDYLQLARLLAADNQEDLFASCSIAAGRQRLEGSERALSLLPASKVLLFDCAKLRAGHRVEFFSTGPDAFLLLVETAHERKARCLVVSAPIPGHPMQWVFPLADPDADLAAVLGLPQLEQGPEYWLWKGDLPPLLAAVEAHYEG